jgi:Mrp family chromosome partitioning ATPase
MPFWSKSKVKGIGIRTPTIPVLAVKGGTGKTTITRELVRALSGTYKIGALDADVDSPNLAESLGVRGWMELTGERKFLPVEYNGAKLFSTSLYHPSAAKGWTKTGQQNQLILRDAALQTEWGPLDYFVIDMPAGSSDEFKAVKEWFLNIVGVVVVTQPNTLSDLARAFDITSRFRLPILGVIENMVEVECQKCSYLNVLWDDHGAVKQMCEEAGVRYLGHVGWVTKLQRSPVNDKPLMPERYRGVIDDLLEVILDGK